MTTARQRFVGGLEQTSAAREWLSALLQAAAVAATDADALRLAVTEAATNVVQHAFAGKYPAVFDLELQIDEATLTVYLRDEGRAFAPAQTAAPDPAALAEGGYGLFLIESVMDEVSYQPAGDAGTVLCMKKRRSTGRDGAAAG